MRFRSVHVRSKLLWNHLKDSNLLYEPDVAQTMLDALKIAMQPMGARIAYLNMSEATILIRDCQTQFSTNESVLICQAVSIFSAIVNKNIKNAASEIPFLFKAKTDIHNIKSFVDLIKGTSRSSHYAAYMQATEKRDGVDVNLLPNIYTKGITVIKNKQTHEYDTYLTQEPDQVFQSYFNKLVSEVTV